MLILIDESGCSGFKFDKGSTEYFVIAMVIFDDLSVAEKMSEEIANLRKFLNIKSEFKFSKTPLFVKDKFFTAVCKYHFKIRALVVNKQKIHLENYIDNFHSYFICKLLAHAAEDLKNAYVKIDGSGDNEFRKILRNYLNQNIERCKIKKFKFVESHRDNLIQLADMTAGAIARAYNPKRQGSDKWLTMLKKSKRVSAILEFKN